MSNLTHFAELTAEKSLKNQKNDEIINKDKIDETKEGENFEEIIENLDCANDYFVENDSKDFSVDEDCSMASKKQKNVDVSEEYIANKEAAVPIRRNTKTYTKDKIKLMSESQRLLRGSESPAIKYKPKQYKTISDFKKAIEKNYENERNKKYVTEKDDDGKENVNKNLNDKDTKICSDPLNLKDRLKLSDEIKLNSQPKTIDYNSQLENILKMKYQNRSGYIELKTKEEYQKDKIKSQNILNILKKTLNHVAVKEDNSFTELNTIIKSVDPVTGQEVLKKKIVSVQKGQSVNNTPILKGIDPFVQKQIMSKLSGEDLIKFKTMSAAEKFSHHRNMLLKESNDKRSKLRDIRIKDMPATLNVELNNKKQNRDDLSDDDYEWTADNEEDDENDFNSDSASDGTDYNNEDSDEEFGIKKKSNKHIRVGIIDDDDEDDQNDKDILSFVDDIGVSNVNECDASKLFTEKDLAKVMSPTGVRSLTRYELSPKIEINKELQNITLPNEAVSIINSLKKKFGLVNKLVSGDSSVLLLPTMKTTTTAIEILLKNHILIQGKLNSDILQDFKDMLSDQEVQMHTTWKDDFNLLSSIKSDDHNLASYSFLNNSFFSTKSFVSGHNSLSIDLDDTLVMKSTVIPKVTESLQETILLDVDESSSSTIILNSEDNSINEGPSNSAALNNYHAKLFKFSDNMTQLFENSTEVVQNNISFIEDSRNKNDEKNIAEDLKDHHSDANDVDLGGNDDNNKDHEKNDSMDSKELKDVCDNDIEDVDLDDGDIDDVDLEESDIEDIHSEDNDSNDMGINHNSRNREDNVDLDDSDHENNKENFNYDGDEEEILRKHVKSGYKFVPTDYIDEEAELSGSDAEEYGPDEDEQDLDKYEDEEGDTDKLPSEGKLRRQIERIHHKLEVDKDAHDIRYIKEMYLEDGDIDIGEDGPRKKQFNWDNMNYNDVPIRIATSDDESEEDCESPERTNTLVVEEEEKDYVEEEGLLLKKYDKFIDNKCSVTNEIEEVLRPAWTTDIISTETKPPSIKKCGSMMNKQMHPLYNKKSDSITKAALNDFDLKTRMSVMFTTPKRPSETILKRGASIFPALSLKRQRTNDEK